MNGEYGHPAHQAVADAARKCYAYAADPAQDPASASLYGTWQVKKLYLHLYEEAQVRMDWNVPLSAFGGRTGLEVATQAMDCHKSQLKYFTMEDGVKYDNTLFGLYASEVGPDVMKDDFMEHIGEDSGI